VLKSDLLINKLFINMTFKYTSSIRLRRELPEEPLLGFTSLSAVTIVSQSQPSIYKAM
jgi:hypothetical protein